MNVIEVRGHNSIVRDFVNSAVNDTGSAFLGMESFFIGDLEEAKSAALIQPKRIISIENLAKSLKGTYKKLSAIVEGSKTLRVDFHFKDLENPDEETNNLINPLLNNVFLNQDKGTINFRYESTQYSFEITKSGGLNFRKYAPEKVVTYVLFRLINA